jgi:hypothetical protein
MTKKSIKKLLEAGYAFIRVQSVDLKDGTMSYRVRRLMSCGSWCTLANFKNQSKLKKWINDIDSDPKGMYLFDV